MTSGASLLTDRGVLKVAGPDTETFLQKLITNSVQKFEPGESRFSGLLTPQGKLLFDFFVVPLPEGPEAGFYFDCTKDQSADLAKRINFHKMRAKVTIEDLSASLAVAAFWGAEPPAIADATVSRDCRVDDMGWRVIAPIASLEKVVAHDPAACEAFCIEKAVPKGGVDFEYGDTFVHDVNLDQLHGVDFKKGCYVGQEVVARVHFRKSARKRIVKVHFEGPAPAPGTPLTAGEINVGLVGSIAGSEGLAQLRLDFLEQAQAAGTTVKAGDVPVAITVPEALLETNSGVEKRL
jgi:tRNA-modifying protein YgfZ